MSGEAVRIRTDFIPAPVDGLNLVASPIALQKTQARQLDNYFIYDWGIRERGPIDFVSMPNGDMVTGMYAFSNNTYQGFLIGSDAGYIYRYNPATQAFTTLSDPAVTLKTNGFYSAFSFNKKIFMGRDATSYGIAVYDITTDSFSETSFTVPSPVDPKIGFAYKNRAYFIENRTSQLRYGGVDAVSGSFSSIDFSSIFQRGTYITFGTSWSYNQGLSNDELMVLGNDAGEVLIYSGDYPAAPNWQLVARVEIPTLLGQQTGLNNSIEAGFVKLGQDILINTSRGVVSLAQIVAGRGTDETYYLISRLIGPVLSSALPERSVNYPFAYFASATELYVLNYERGAWSKFTGFTGEGETIRLISCSRRPAASDLTPPLTSYVLAAVDGANGFYQFDESDMVGDSSATYTYATPYLDMGVQSQKLAKHVRVLGRVTGGTSFSNTLGVTTDFSDTVGSQDTKSTTVSTDDYTRQELVAAGVGEHLSFVFSKTGSDSHQNEISGSHVFFELGGIY